MRHTLLALLAVTACSPPEETSAAGARLEVDWTGDDTGRIAGRAAAEWCDSLRVLEIRVIQGDSGLAIALYPSDSIRPDSYPLRQRARVDSTRPGSAVALRWFAETTIKGFRGDSGTVVVQTGAQGLGGRFEARLQSVNDADRLRLRGSFRDIPVVPAAVGCGVPAREVSDSDNLTDLDEVADSGDVD